MFAERLRGADVVGTYAGCLRALHDDPDTDLLLLAVDLARDSYLSPDYVEAALAVKDVEMTGDGGENSRESPGCSCG